MTPRLRWVVVPLVVFFCSLRFVGLNSSPPGFYVDEAAIAAQVLCVRDGGRELSGREWPLFARVLGGGYATPPMLYGGAVWTTIFGSSIASFRAFSAAFGVLFVVASFFLASRFWNSREAGWLAALSAAVSPWAFQFSRISWDPALAPALLAGSLALLFASRRPPTAALAGVTAALAAYSYPPIRVQLMLVIPPALLLLPLIAEDPRWKKRGAFVAALVMTSLPLVVLTVRGDIQGRFRMLSVFNESYLRGLGDPTLFAGLREFVMNLFLNFSPSYLFWTGDENPRHATQAFGQWSPLEILASFILVAVIARWSMNRAKLPSESRKVAFVVVGYLAGVVPAALTWESNPHALRSIGAVVFLCLGTGGALAWLCARRKAGTLAIAAIAVSFAVPYYYDYFVNYPKRAGLYFDQTAVTEIAKLDSITQEIARANPYLKDYPKMALRYFQQAKGTRVCE